MAAGAKFDVWYNNAGTLNQTVRQVQYGINATEITVNSSSPTLMWNLPKIARTYTNSAFLVLLQISIGWSGTINGNADSENHGLLLYRNGTPISFGHSTGNGYFYYTDVPWVGAGSYGGLYDEQQKHIQYFDVPPGDIGQSFQYTLYGVGTPMYFNRPAQSAGRQWAQSSVTIMEITQ